MRASARAGGGAHLRWGLGGTRRRLLLVVSRHSADGLHGIPLARAWHAEGRCLSGWLRGRLRRRRRLCREPSHAAAAQLEHVVAAEQQEHEPAHDCREGDAVHLHGAVGCNALAW